MGGEYRDKKINVADAERYTETPEKNAYGHVADALQYAIIGGGEFWSVMDRQQTRQQAQRQTYAVSDDNPEGAYRGAPIGGQQRYAVSE